jgi:hypothetical protein
LAPDGQRRIGCRTGFFLPVRLLFRPHVACLSERVPPG